MIYLLLFMEFAKIGIFSLGGGYATLPFLYHMSEQYHWFSSVELTQMLAVSSITPGPVGINVATFAGFKTAGILGSIIATNAIMIPSFVIVIFISKMLKKFKDNKYMNAALYSLRPATAAMIGAVGVRLFKDAIIRSGNFSSFTIAKTVHFIDLKGLLLLSILFYLSLKLKRDPLIYLIIGAIAGVILHINNIF